MFRVLFYLQLTFSFHWESDDQTRYSA
jgi:hypothetical protein